MQENHPSHAGGFGDVNLHVVAHKNQGCGGFVLSGHL